MKKIRWQLVIIFLAGLVIGVLLLNEQPVNIPLMTPQPVEGGSYTEGLVGSFQRLNPLLDTYNAADRDIDRLIYSRLIRFDDRGNPSGDLAETWGISQDGTIYNFQLRSGVKWHDGQPLTTADVVFTIEMMKAGGDAVPEDLKTFWDTVEVVVLDETVMQFLLPEPFAPFLDYLSFGVLPEHILGGMSFDEIVDAEFNLQPVGSGPYRVERLIVENSQIQGVVLQAYEGYYGQQPYIPSLIFRYYPDSASAFQAYQEGTVQGVSQITQDVLPAALAEADLSLYTSREPELSMVLFNLKDAQASFLADKDVRRALYLGINRQAIIDRILQGQAILANGPIFPGTWAYYDGIEALTYEPDNSLTLLKKAGYILAEDGDVVRKKGDVALALTLIHPDSPLHTAIARQIADDWQKLGVSVTLEAMSYDQLLAERLTPRSYQAALVDLNLSRSPDPDPYPFWDQLQATNGQNYSQWDNRFVSEYLEQARVTIDQAERARLYRNFQVIFSEELPSLPLFYPVTTYGISREVQGVRIGPLFDTSDRFNTQLEWFLVAQTSSQVTATP